MKLILHRNVDDPIVSNSKYGEDGTRTIAGTGTFSGTYENTFAETPARAVANGPRTAERIVDAGIIEPSFVCRGMDLEAQRND